jgi:hypothetical protein
VFFVLLLSTCNLRQLSIFCHGFRHCAYPQHHLGLYCAGGSRWALLKSARRPAQVAPLLCAAWLADVRGLCRCLAAVRISQSAPSQNFRIGRGLTSAWANHESPSPCALFCPWQPSGPVAFGDTDSTGHTRHCRSWGPSSTRRPLCAGYAADGECSVFRLGCGRSSVSVCRLCSSRAAGLHQAVEMVVIVVTS